MIKTYSCSGYADSLKCRFEDTPEYKKPCSECNRFRIMDDRIKPSKWQRPLKNIEAKKTPLKQRSRRAAASRAHNKQMVAAFGEINDIINCTDYSMVKYSKIVEVMKRLNAPGAIRRA